MSTLPDYRRIHAGKDIVVCGCGPSLNELEAPDRFVTIGVNDVERLFTPTYLVVVNPPGQFADGRFEHVRASRAEALFTHLELGVEHPRVVRFRLGRYGGVHCSDPEALNYTQNSPYVAVCLAAHMGARRIGLIGVDFTDHHFFGETGTHPLAARLELIDRQYGALARSLANQGVELVNLSAISRLRSLRRCPFAAFRREPQARATPRTTVSVLMLVRDEAPTLPRAIESVEGLADEVIVGVDTETTDDSAATARRLGARVVPIAFEGDFAQAHNRLDALASGSWGFKLDGHEYLAAGDAARLRSILAAGADGCGAVGVALRTTEVDGGLRALVLRAYRRGEGVDYRGSIHEQVVGWGERFHGAPEITIHHDRPQARADQRAAQRRSRDVALLEHAVGEDPSDTAALFHLAALCRENGELDRAIRLLDRCADSAAGHKAVFRCEVDVLRARCALESDDLDLADHRAAQALRACWNVPEAYCVRAQVALQREPPDVGRAEQLLRCALAVPHVPWEYPAQRRHHSWWPRLQLARLALDRGLWDAAGEALQGLSEADLPEDVRAELRTLPVTDDALPA